MTDAFLSAMSAAGFGSPDQKKKTKEKKQSQDKPKGKSMAELEKDRQDRLATNQTRVSLDLELLETKVKTAKINYQQLSRDIILRDEIQPVWNRLYKSSSYFADFGQKYAPEWAAALGVSDTERISKLEKLIDEATEKFMDDFISQLEDEI